MSDRRVEYEEVEQRLCSMEMETTAAEVHGLLCGLLSGGSKPVDQFWFAELFAEMDEDDLLRQECRQTLQRLYDQTLAAMSDSGMAFVLFLPSDEKPLRQRASGVRDWCIGYLYGLGLTKGVDDAKLSSGCRESLADISEITRMNTDVLGDDEEEEEALMQVTEFLRVAAMLVHDELTAARVVQA